MRVKSLFLIVATLVGSIGCSSGGYIETCSGNIVIETEADLQDALFCESITGDLKIDRQDWISTLDFPYLESVGGKLILSWNIHPSAIEMTNLTTVGGQLQINNSDALLAIDMPSLTTVGGDLKIFVNDVLPTLEGLSGLAEVDGGLSIDHNDCLSQADAEAFAEGIEVGRIVSVHDNGANYPCD